MSKAIIKIERDDDDVLGLLLDVYEETRQFEFHPRVTSYTTKTKRFLEECPHYRVVPRSFIRGCFKRGEPTTDSPTGIKIGKKSVKVGDLGTIWLATPIERLVGLQRVGFSPFNGGEVHVYASIIRKGGTKFSYSQPEESIHDLKKKDPVVYYLLVNQIPPGEDFWKKHAVLTYVRRNPGVTRNQVERMGIRSDRDWDLLVDFQDGMQEWLRAVSKPPECDILSRGQLVQRQKRELRLPDVINDHDVDRGDMKGQSYDAQIYRALHPDSYDLLS